jgi:hypothetical protein
MSEFIPSVDELVEVHRAFGALYKIINLYDNVDVQEKRALPHIVRIADALRPVRLVVDKIEEWPKKIERSIPLLIEWFDVLISRWGWEGVVQPEPSRSAYLEKRKESAESLRRSILEAAVSASADWNKSTPCKYDDLADEGRKLGILPTMMLEEAEPAYDLAKARFDNEPRIGRCSPEITHEENRALDRVFREIDPYMKEVARECCAGPPVKTTSPTPLATANLPDQEDYITFAAAKKMTGLESYQITRKCDAGKVRSRGKGRGRLVHAADLARCLTEPQKDD